MKHNNFERRSWHFIKLTTRKGRVGFLSWKWAFSEWTGWVWKVQSWKCLNSNCSNPILIQQCYFRLFCSWCSWTKLVSSTSFFHSFIFRFQPAEFMPVFWLHCDFLWHVCMLVGGIELDRLRGCPIFPTTTLLDVHTLQKSRFRCLPEN